MKMRPAQRARALRQLHPLLASPIKGEGLASPSFGCAQDKPGGGLATWLVPLNLMRMGFAPGGDDGGSVIAASNVPDKAIDDVTHRNAIQE
jgi:hypothetical protein